MLKDTVRRRFDVAMVWAVVWMAWKATVARNFRRRFVRWPWQTAMLPERRGVTDNHGHARWLSTPEAQRLFPGPAPGYGGVVVGEAYRVDQDRSAMGKRFLPHDQTTWGRGGTAPLLIDPCTERIRALTDLRWFRSG